MSCLFQGSTACSHVVEWLQQWPYYLLLKIHIYQESSLCNAWRTATQHHSLHISMQIKNRKEKTPVFHILLYTKTFYSHDALLTCLSLKYCSGLYRDIQKVTGLIKIKLVLVNGNISPKDSNQAYNLSCFWLHWNAYDLLLAWIRDVEWHLNI